MDLRLPTVEPTAAERAAVDAVLGAPSSGWAGGQRDAIDGHVAHGGHAARAERHLLLPALHALQDAVGWLSEGGLGYVCLRLTVPPAEAYGVATFYALFATTPQPPRVAHVCDDVACIPRGAEALIADLTAWLGPEGEPSTDGASTWHRSPCLGQCERAPAVLCQLAGATDGVLAPATAAAVAEVLAGAPVPASPAPDLPQAGEPGLRLLGRVGVVDPASLDDYRAKGGYAALRRALQVGRDRVIREVTDSQLLGRGGAAFPTGRKWSAVAGAAATPHYLICNADESEPGTFKDRVVMESDPFAVVEAMTIAGYAVGAELGFLYVRGEYPLATARLQGAIAQARVRGLLGEDVLGEDVRFDIELRRGAGAYICGEETALMNSIEGSRGEPRNKPPFPTVAGLFGKPTAVNNVETLVNVLEILTIGGPAFAETGTADSTGSRLWCVAGCAARPGLYELPFGATLPELLERSGGMRDGRQLQALLLGGAAGTFLLPHELDLPLTFEGARAAGASLGSGVVLPLDDTVDLRAVLARIAAFFRDESCGQCVPCRIGTVRQEEALHRLAATPAGGGRDGEVALLGELAQVMRDASICGLGHTAATAVQSALAKKLI